MPLSQSIQADIANTARIVRKFSGMSNDELLRSAVLAFIKTQPEETATEEDLTKVMKWADGLQKEMALLGLFLIGKLAATVKDGEILFVTSEESGKCSENG